MFRWEISRGMSALALTTALLFVSSPVLSGDGQQEQQAQNLARIGLDFERSLLEPHAERLAALESSAISIDEVINGGLESEQKNAAYLLSAEIQFALGNYDVAQTLFEKAKDKKGPFADDAAFREIIALEAQGRELEAAKEWKKWEKRYPDSPLSSQVLVARTWNAIRRDSLSEVTSLLTTLESRFPHMQNDPRVILARATSAYLAGDPGSAIAELGSPKEPLAIYLLALTLEADGQVLKAAAKYQEVAERFPNESFSDYALLGKAKIFLSSGAYRSAVDEFGRVAELATNPEVKAEAELLAAASVFLDGDAETATTLLRDVTVRHSGTTVAARAQLLLGEVLMAQSRFEEAIPEFNRVLTEYFEHELAASAQYQVGRCLDALGRHNEATSAYQLVVSGYPLAPQSPAAAYLAGVGMIEARTPTAAIPYFQLVLDRYADDMDEGPIVFPSPEHRELLEASLCLLEWSYHQAGDLGQLSGVPHLMLMKLPASSSPWRAWALLIDADALAAQARHEEAQKVLQMLVGEYPNHEVSLAANRLLAWTYAEQGNDDLAVQTEEGMLARYASETNDEHLSSAYLNKAHILFNGKKYDEAAQTYDDFLERFPDHPNRLLALYQAGLCHARLHHTGDAVDRWEELTSIAPADEISERAWVRAGDIYFTAEHFDDAKRCYQGLVSNFPESRAAALGTLRLAQCDYNAGRDSEALQTFSMVVDRYPGTGIAAEAERGIERSLYRLGQGESGTEVLGELVDRYPNSSFAADALFELALRKYEAEDYEGAAEGFRRVVTQFPGYSAADQAHFRMADSYRRIGDTEQALRAYEQFLMFFPESELRTTVHFQLGSLRFDNEDYMRAALDFTVVLENETSPETAAASLYNMAMCRSMLGDTQATLDALRRYRELYPNDDRTARVAFQLGNLADEAGDNKQAIQEFTAALSAETDGAKKTEIYYRIGACREELAENDNAIKAYVKAIEYTDKSDAFRLSAVARCAALYEKDGKYKKAISAYQDLIKNAKDPELVLAAKQRAEHLETQAK